MEQGRPSTTALMVAKVRARHQVLDDPLVLADPIALKILGEPTASELRSLPRNAEDMMSRAMRGPVVARSRIAEDALHAAVKRGVRQYVVLGAGLDTFAYRNPYPESQLRVFEVDHPATQAWKRQLLSEAKIETPPSLTFAPVDFETETLAHALRDAGFRPDQPAFFSWLGVTMYLKPEAVAAALGYIASLPQGSGVTFDFVLRPSMFDLPARVLLLVASRRFARMGEPWYSNFLPDVLAGDMKAMGFAQLKFISRDEMYARFFKGRNDDLSISSIRLGGMMLAEV